jgi:hypothetical protein
MDGASVRPFRRPLYHTTTPAMMSDATTNAATAPPITVHGIEEGAGVETTSGKLADETPAASSI